VFTRSDPKMAAPGTRRSRCLIPASEEIERVAMGTNEGHNWTPMPSSSTALALAGGLNHRTDVGRNCKSSSSKSGRSASAMTTRVHRAVSFQ
jgi:hypothetical protein